MSAVPHDKSETPSEAAIHLVQVEQAELRRSLQASQRAAVASWLATAVNVLTILGMAFVIGPKVERVGHQMNRVGEETAKNRQAVQENRDILGANQEDLLAHRKTIQRLNTLLDEAIAKAKAREKAVEKAEKDKEKKP